MSSPVKFQSIIPDEFSASLALSLTHTTLSSPWGLVRFPHLVYPTDGESVWKKKIVYRFLFLSMCSAIRTKRLQNVLWGIISSFPWVVFTAQWLDYSEIEILKGDLLRRRGDCWLSSLWEGRACSNGERQQWAVVKNRTLRPSTWFSGSAFSSSGPWTSHVIALCLICIMGIIIVPTPCRGD